MQKVAVLGASNNPERISHQAVMRLMQAGHRVFPIHPTLKEVEGVKTYKNIRELPETPDTLSVYLSEKNSIPLIEDILELKPGRIILNPGAENAALESAAETAGIPVEHACTLVLLGTGQF